MRETVPHDIEVMVSTIDNRPQNPHNLHAAGGDVPQADVPVVQLSLRVGYDPAEHLAIGRALVPLRDQGVLIVGSGLSYHNLRRMGPPAAVPSNQFDDWLQQTLITIDPEQRAQRLIDWQHAPAARVAHPQADHLLPLMAAVGAAEHDEGSPAPLDNWAAALSSLA